ncbi:hypothetical protein D9M71_832840 [compost metagenome]
MLTGELTCFQVPPLSSETMMNPRSPTATRRCPDLATLSMTDCAAMALVIDGCTGSPSVCAAATVPVSAVMIDTLSMNALNGCGCKSLGV